MYKNEVINKKYNSKIKDSSLKQKKSHEGGWQKSYYVHPCDSLHIQI
jgi:hypothetical protein